jgi:hypothetical protein
MADQTSMSAAIAQTTSLIELITSSPSPSVSINGESIDMVGYLSALKDTLPILMQIRQNLDGPFQRITRVKT